MLGLSLAAGAVPAGAAPGAIPPYIARALADPARGSAARLDGPRRAAALLAFAGVQPGDTVIELLPGRGYWTQVLSKIVGPRGRVFAVSTDAVALRHQDDFSRLRDLASDLRYDNVTVMMQAANKLDVLDVPPADRVLSIDTLHVFDSALMHSITPAVFARKVRARLKPGGTLVIADYAAAPGATPAAAASRHRIDPARVEKQITANGFALQAKSGLLRAPEDDRRRDALIAARAGRADRFLFRFVRSGGAGVESGDR